MRVVQLNLAADFTIPGSEALLDRYHTLTGWSRALAAGGAEVTVVQRFTTDVHLQRAGVPYVFVRDGSPGLLPPWATSAPAIAAVRDHAPDVVHVNGLMFPEMTVALREALGARVGIVLQNHSGIVPRSAPLLRRIVRRRWTRAFQAADACSFTSAALAAPWRNVGLPATLAVIEIPEASTGFTPILRDEARAITRITGAPALLWVGRLDANKDPLTVLRGIETAFVEVAEARLWMLAVDAGMRDAVRQRIDASPELWRRVTMLEPVPYERMPLYYSSADILVSGSHHEGSGYALIEAIACGVTPCVTDIPAFRALSGSCGVLWRPGDPDACAVAIRQAAALTAPAHRKSVRAHFDDRLSWRVIGRDTLAAYSGLLAARHART
jgi:glycosyltransferase involved in cell wall biosynthesis